MPQNTCDFLKSAFDYLSEHSFNESAFFNFDRNDHDSFELSIKITGNRLSDLSNSDLSMFLPRGSSWKAALGWRSICLYPVLINYCPFICITVHGSVMHSTRGAYPKMKGLITLNNTETIDYLKCFAKKLCPASSYPTPQYGVVLGGKSPKEHAKIERGMIEHATNLLIRKQFPLIKTTILSDNEIITKKNGELGDRIHVVWDSYLIGNIREISENFSSIAQARLLFSRGI